jgi:N-acyl-D-amino-acid deacylase
MYDLVLHGGKIADGTGAALFAGNVCIRDGKIEKITTETVTDARQVLDVTGLVVSPGFIDIHTHSDNSYKTSTPLESHLAQGVTTEITGNCGTSSVPSSAKKKEEVDAYLMSKRGRGGLMSVSDYFKDINDHHPLVNYGALIGHGTLRLAVMGFVNRDPDETEMREVAAFGSIPNISV